MSTLGGHDVVFQMRRDKLLYLLQKNLTVQGIPLQPPFRLSLAAPSGGQVIKPQKPLDLLVKSVDLTLQPGTKLCDLHIKLDGIVRLDSAPDVPFQNGDLAIRVELQDGGLLFAQIKQATLTVPNVPAIAGIANFAVRVNAEADKLINAERDKNFALFSQVALDSEGNPIIDAQGRTMPHPVTSTFIFVSNTRVLDAETVCTYIGGDLNPGTLTSTVSFAHPFTFAFAAETLKRLLLCRGILLPQDRDPALAGAVFAPPSESERAKLPPPCGDGELSLGDDDTKIGVNRIDFTFRDGYIDVDGSFDADNGCWKVRGGTFKQQIFLDFIGGSIVPRLEPPDPVLTYNVEIEWYCWVGLVGLRLLLSGINIIPAIWPFASGRTVTAPGQPVPGQQPSALEPVTYTGLQVSPEGVVLQGDGAGGGFVPQVTQPAVHIRAEHTPQNVRATGSGPITVQAVTCPPATFQYLQTVQDDFYTLTVANEWLMDPVDYAWTVNGTPITPLSSGVLRYNGTVKTAVPPPDGEPISGHAIELAYTNGTHILGLSLKGSSATLTLAARQQDLNYDIRVEVRATDALGREFSDAANLRIVGDIATFDGDYYEYLNHCLKAATDLVNKKAKWKSKVRPGEPQELYKDLLDIVTAQIHDGDAEAAALIPSLKSAYGVAAVNRALAGKLRE
jgi:hypothetical protein